MPSTKFVQCTTTRSFTFNFIVQGANLHIFIVCNNHEIMMSARIVIIFFAQSCPPNHLNLLKRGVPHIAKKIAEQLGLCLNVWE